MYMYMNKTAQNMHAYKLKKFGSKQAVCLHSLDPNKRFIVTPYIYTKTQQGVNISWRKKRVGERGEGPQTFWWFWAACFLKTKPIVKHKINKGFNQTYFTELCKNKTCWQISSKARQLIQRM